MANTTNFGWETPDDTDLVKDGAAAMRTLGSAIDTSFVDLKGGTTGQVLSKATNTDLDYTWITPNVGDITEVQAGTGISVASGTGPIPVVTNSMATTIDAKGDIIVGSGADAFGRLPLGTNGDRLVADSAETLGVKWQADTVNTVIDAKGDLLVGTAADTLAKLAVGSNNQVLTADSTTATGLKWAAAAGGGKVLQVVGATFTPPASTTSNSLQDTGITVSITPSSASSKIFVVASFMGEVVKSGSSTSNYGVYELTRGSSTKLTDLGFGNVNYASASGNDFFGSIAFSYLDSPSTTSSTTYKVRFRIDSCSTIYVSYGPASITVMEIGA